jgi:carbon-monoxide dehydrogenase medium subunit
MKAPQFSYCKAHTLEQAFDLMEQYGDEARILAGGQTLLATLNMRLSAPRILIDLVPLRATLGQISVQDGLLTIGALVTHDDIDRSELVKRHVPLLSAAVPHVAHAAIRNFGTFGGSIALADPAAEYPACAVALDATFVLASRAGTRRVKASEFFLGLYSTAMEPGEILVAGDFPMASDATRCSFLELARRHGDYAIVGIAANCSINAGQVSGLRIAFLSAGDTPKSASEAAQAVEGGRIDASSIADAKAALAKDLDPPADLTTSSATKLHLARVLLGRALLQMAA